MEVNSFKCIELVVKILEIMFEGLCGDCIIFFIQGGSDVLEVVVKFVKCVIGCYQIIVFYGGYYGIWNVFNVFIIGIVYCKGFGFFMGGVIYVLYFYVYCFFFDISNKSVEQIVGEYVDYLFNIFYIVVDDVVVVIVELVQGEGGYVLLLLEFLQILCKVCDCSGVLLIVDEVQVGVGCIGKMWVVEYLGVKFDMLIFGKGIGGDMFMVGLVMCFDFVVKIFDGLQFNIFVVNLILVVVVLINISIL